MTGRHLVVERRHPARPRLSQKEMGLVFGAFTLAYALFEIPTGYSVTASARARC